MNRYFSAARVAPVAAAAALASWVCAWRVHGSIAAADWLPVALVLAGLVAAATLAGGARQPSRAALLAVAGLVGLGAWTALSLAWTPLPTLARDEVLLLALYALAFALPTLVLRSGGERLAAAGAVGAAAVGVALAAALELHGGGSAEAAFGIGRLELPVTYANAEAAVLVVGFWPCVAVASARTAPLAARAPAVGGAALLLGGWLATQSKGAGIGLLVSAVVVLALAPGRLRLAVPVVLAAGCAAAAVAPLTEPYRAEDARLAAASAAAGDALLAIAAAGAALGLAYALADRRIRLSVATARLAGRAALAALVAGLALLTALGIDRLGRPDRALAEAWDSFSTFHEGDSARSHLVSLGGSNRYDFWRVALAGAREHPVAGIGARGFQAEYLREGRSLETPARAHSLPLDTLLELGAVGLLLLLLALAPAVGAAAQGVRAGAPWAAAALGSASGWLAHAAVDWTWAFPAAGIPFFLLLGVGASGGRTRPLRGAAAITAGALAAAAALVLFAPAWIAARLLERALDEPARAETDVRLARRLDPVTTRPLVVQSQVTGALAPLREAARREPASAGIRYLLGVRLLEAGRTSEARRELQAAHALAPREPLILDALERAGG